MLEQLNHQVFTYFEQLCAIPHGSYNTKAISDFMVKFGQEHGFEVVLQDEVNNVVLAVPATPGYEEAKPVIIQGHLDMVCEKNAELDFDFMTQGLNLAIDGDYIHASGTTLGGDDGIAVAMGMAIATDPAVIHPKLYLVFTTEEETGMEGARGLDMSKIPSDILINIDSEAEGIITCGCAGGSRVHAKFPVTKTNAAGVLVNVKVSGLQGGHSGVEIHCERTNANKLLGRVMAMLEEKVQFSVAGVNGGLMDNAIPREAQAQIVVKEADLGKLEASVAELHEIVKKECAISDAGVTLTVSVEEQEGTFEVFDETTTKAVMSFYLACPNGIQHMHAAVKGLVETSLNLGIVRTEEDGVLFIFALRSAVRTRREYMELQLKSLVTALGGEYTFMGSYPAWEFKNESVLRDLAISVYEELYGAKPVIEIIHAGLECGILSEKNPNLDCISVGPNMQDIHTPCERLSISSTRRMYDYISKLLQALAQ